MTKCKKIIDFIKTLYKKDIVPLHEPVFIGNEKKYVNECIDSTFVSSVGEFVEKVEKEFAKYVKSKYAIAVVNGTSALHIALEVIGVKNNTEVITQPLSFIATANAIKYCKADPIFLDVDLDTLGLSPKALKDFLEKNCILKNNQCINTNTNKVIKACVPMHTFGHPCRVDEIVSICNEWNIEVIEDSAEALGSFYKNKHVGTFGKVGIFSFNGNKIITSGGGGMVVTDDEYIAKKIKHLTTTAKVPHPYEYIHDAIGYNYRMPNINAALLLAQLENIDLFLNKKRELAKIYNDFFKSIDIKFITEPKNAKSNYWLNAIMIDNKKEFLEYSNKNGVMTRPIWRLINKLDMYNNYQTDSLKNANYLEKVVVNIPSGCNK